MPQGGLGAVAGAQDELREAMVEAAGVADHHRFVQEADRPFQLRPVAEGGGGADGKILRAAVAQLEDLEDGEEEDIGRDAVGPGGGAQARAQLRR